MKENTPLRVAVAQYVDYAVRKCKYPNVAAKRPICSLDFHDFMIFIDSYYYDSIYLIHADDVILSDENSFPVFKLKKKVIRRRHRSESIRSNMGNFSPYDSVSVTTGSGVPVDKMYKMKPINSLFNNSKNRKRNSGGGAGFNTNSSSSMTSLFQDIKSQVHKINKKHPVESFQIRE
jgi:hypothetical protein